MEGLTPHHITVLFLSLAILLGVARILGELAQKLHQPAILGELLAGVLLGPTILGNIAPGFTEFLFPAQGVNALALETITTLAIVLFLLVAGIEVDLSTMWKQGSLGMKIGVASIVAPFAMGFVGAYWFPQFLGGDPDSRMLTFALFFATALSISALPVIAKTLMDMGLYRSDLGMVVISAAVFNDLIGWVIFAIVLGMMDVGAGHGNSIGFTIGLTLLFAVGMLTIGRWLIHKTLPYLQAYTQWPGGVLGFALTLALLGAAFTEWVGIHAIFGAFLVGVAIGDSSYLRERTRVTIEHFVAFIFAPLFFASIGLRVDFLSHFDVFLVLTVLAIACACKLLGGYVGAKWGGMTDRESWAVGFAMNSRGAMEIILGILALEAGIIDDRLFVALVVMAIVTSMISGPGMRHILRPKSKRQLSDLLSSDLYLRGLKAATREEAIRELARATAKSTALKEDDIVSAVMAREAALSTGLGNAIALPHARLDGIKAPLLAVGFSERGIDFDGPDGKPATLIMMVLTNTNDPTAQLEIGADVAQTFRDPNVVERAMRTKSYTDFLALLKILPTESAKPH